MLPRPCSEPEIAGSGWPCASSRLRTVCFYDQILVLGRGAVLEAGPPLRLLTVAHGELHRLAQETGDFEALVGIAREAAAEGAEL